MRKLDKKNIQNILALTPMQDGILFHYLQNPASLFYLEQLSLNISGEIDLEVFTRAWNAVIDTNEVLRTVFRWEKVDKPVQIVLKEFHIHIRYYDFSGENTVETKNRLEELKSKDKKETFDLRDVPFRVTLCKLGKADYEMIVSNHHILYDGWSNGIIFKEFFKAYNDFASGEKFEKPVKTVFKKFIQWYQKQDIGGQEQYWKKYLEDFDTVTYLPVKETLPVQGEAGRTGHFRFGFSEGLTENLEEFVKKHRITSSSLLYSAWGLLLQKYTNSDNVVFGTTVSGRSAKLPGIEEIVGLFINTLPLRVRSNPNEKIEGLLAGVDNALRMRVEYESTPLVEIKKYSEIGGREELFDTIMVIENYPLDSRLILEDSRISINSYSMVERTHYDLTVAITAFNGIEVVFSYNEPVLDEEFVRRLADHFRNIVERIMENPGGEVSSLEIISPEEKKRVLQEFNGKSAEYPKDKTIHRLFVEQAAKAGERAALVVHSPQMPHLTYITYNQLNEKSDQLARRLKSRGVKRGSIVGIQVDRSVSMVVGILGILKSGGAYLPLVPSYPKSRTAYILGHSGSRWLVSTRDIAGAMEFTGGTIYLDEDESSAGPVLSPYETDQPTDPAYVIYTSGTTGNPKGVLVEHRSVVNTLTALHNKYPFNRQDVYLLKTSYVFDVSVTELFGWFLGGGKLSILEKDGERDPHNILAAVEETGVTHINFVPSMFNAFTTALTPGNIGKLSTLKYIFLAGEVLRAEAVDKFRLLNSQCRLENIYGPTEAAVYASWYSLSEWNGSHNIPIGKPLHNVGLYILDVHGRLQPQGIPGELFISGEGLSRGYLNDPEQTREKFVSNPFYPAGKLYKTGDYVRWLPDGNIEFLGRIDHQVKIRGFRVELGEIENRLLRYEDVKEAVVLARGDGENKYLCAYISTAYHEEPHSFIPRLKEYLAGVLPDYMIPAFFVLLEHIPLTASGKLDRKALPEPEKKSAFEYTAPGSPEEEVLVEIWSAILGMEKRQIGIDDNFFHLGGHSLKAVSMAARIHKQLHVFVPVAEVFNAPTIRGLAGYLKMASEDRCQLVEPAEKKEYYVLTSAQKRLAILQQMAPENTAYNMTGIIRLNREQDITKLEGIFKELIRRHESLRTSFHMLEEEPVQVLHDNVEFKLEFHDTDRMDDFVRPFDLSKAPLFRVGLIKGGKGNAESLLVVDMHHIICDGVSLEVLEKDFTALAGGETLPALAIQYKDYAEWRSCEERKEETKRQEAYWLKEFSGEIPVLNLPSDFVRPVVRSFEGDVVRFGLGASDYAALQKTVVEEEVTLFMVLLGVTGIMLSRLCGVEDTVIGTPTAGRRHADIENVIGMFVNTLALRNRCEENFTFSQFLKTVKNHTLAAFENQDYPFDDLVDRLSLQRDPGRNPLFDVMFSLETFGAGSGLYHEYQNRTSKFDLTITGTESGGELAFAFNYSSILFKENTIRRFAGYYTNILSAVTADVNCRLAYIEMLSGEEKKRILIDFNNGGTEAGVFRGEVVHELFRLQAEKTPHGIAVIGPGGGDGKRYHLSYRELDQRAARLAQVLREKGVTANTIVGLMVKRSLEMVIGIFGILKAGGAYLPIDPSYPAERKKYMMADSAARSMVVESLKGNEDIAACDMTAIEDIDWSAPPTTELETTAGPQDLIYTIFTSGSTGRPKGAGVFHKGFMNLVNWYAGEFRFHSRDRVLLLTSLSFDLTQKNIYMPLIVGGLLDIPLENYFDPRAVLQEVYGWQITWLNCTPGMFYKLVEDEEEFPKLSSLRYVFLGGEPVVMPLLSKWIASGYYSAEIVNTYGPTECSDVCSFYRIEPPRSYSDRTVPIGKPVYNTQFFILDNFLHLLPIGVPGELFISGEGVGMGYINRTTLTFEKFIDVSFDMWGEKRLYRTGDLVKWRPDGNIEFIGRIDGQVKIRGVRVELGEIENRLLEKPEIEKAVVIDRVDKNGDTFLCAYIVLSTAFRDKKTFDTSQLVEFLSEALPQAMIPSYFTVIESIPLTPNGKIDRRALPEPGINESAVGGNNYLPPRDELDEILVDLWAEILAVHKGLIGIDSNFFELGGHSLSAAVLTGKLRKQLHVQVPLGQLFRVPTIRGLTGYIKAAVQEKEDTIEAAEEKKYYRLSSAQKRLYIIQQMDTGSAGYNIPIVMILQGKLDKDKFNAVFKEVIHRHESFRTSFHIINEEPVQKIHRSVDFEIEYYEKEQGDSAFIVQFIRPFDLSHAPLLRAGLIKTSVDCFYLVVDMHHIISDGTSMAILIKEVMAVYRGEKMPSLRIHYKDFAEWQNSRSEKRTLKEQEEYWLSQFAEEPPVLEFPLDYPRPLVRSFAGNHLSFELTEAETSAVKALALEKNVTLFMLLLAVCNTWIAKLTGEEDITIGSPIAGRSHDDLQGIIGMFVNTLALRNYPASQKKFTVFLDDLRNRTLQAFKNQDYQFEELVEKVVETRDTSRNALLDVMFVFQNMDIPEIQIPGLHLKFHDYENKTAKFDLNLEGKEKDGQIVFNLEFSTTLFKEDTARRFIRYFKKILQTVTADPEIKISDIEIMGEEEKAGVLKASRGVEEPFDLTETIHGMFERVASEKGDSPALVFNGAEMSYGELNRRSDRLAAVLRAKGVGPNTIVGLMVERSFEMIVGILAVLKAGGAYCPIDPRYPEERKRYMLENSNASLVLVNFKVNESVEVLDIRREDIYRGEEYTPEPGSRGGDLVYAIYTSGSTGTPKGVLLKHKNLVNLIIYQYKYTTIDFSRVLQFTTISFDVSFQEIFSTLLAGGTLFLIDESTRNDIPALFRTVSENRITTLFLPTSFVKFIFNEEEYARLVPAGIKHIVVAGEQLIVNNRCRDFLKKHHTCLHNHYGPSETHVVTALTLAPGEEIPEFPYIGKPVMNTGIYILDKGKHLLPTGVSGELYISGMQVGRGYVGREDQTRERFVVNPFCPTEMMYRTGDLSRRLPDGNIEFLGRADQQVKIRGFRVEPGEIESHLRKIEFIKDAVVVVKQVRKGENALCAYVVLEDDAAGLHVPELRNILSGSLPDYMIPSYFVHIPAIPLTPNKKIDRKALPEPALTLDRDYTAPRDRLETALAAMWSEILGIDKETIGIDSDFFELGGHSLKAIKLVSKIHKELHVKLSLVEVFKRPVIRRLAEFIRTGAAAGAVDTHVPIDTAELKEYYALSPAQRSLYFLYELERESTVYNLPAVMVLNGQLDKARFQETFTSLIRRHESLRTSFMVKNGEPFQKVHESVDFEIDYYHTESTSGETDHQVEKIITSFVCPFDLSKAPLMRIGLIKIGKSKHILLMDMHHIVSDGVSMNIFVRDFMSIYEGREPAALQCRYIDYCEWLKSGKGREIIEKQALYWQEEFAEEVPVLQLPYDYLRPAVQSFAGASFYFNVDSLQTAELNRLAQEEDVTLYMLLAGLFNILLAKLSGMEDITFGTPMAGRRHSDLETCIGMFVNTLALRNQPAGEKGFTGFLQELKEKTVKSFENQDYPFEELLEKRAGTRDTNRNPLFDVVFVLQNMDFPEIRIPGLELLPYSYETRTAKFDLTLRVVEQEEELQFEFEYCTALFKSTTIKRFAVYFKNIISVILDDRHKTISEIEILTAEEKSRLLYGFNDTQAGWPHDQTLHQLFEARVERAPDRIALVYEESQLTYKELNRRAARLAAILRKKGIKPDSVVGILVERSMRMITGLLAVLKSGVAYLPISPSFPSSRVEFVLKDSAAEVLLVEKAVAEIHKDALRHTSAHILYLDEINMDHDSDSRLSPVSTPSSLAYLIYTSGTTGKPKGSLIEHRNVVRLMFNDRNLFDFCEQDAWTMFHSYSFDFSVWEMYGALLFGGKLLVIPQMTAREPKRYVQVLKSRGVTVLNQTPSAFYTLMEEELKHPGSELTLRYVIFGGEALNPVLLKDWKQKYPRTRLINMFGITETTVHVTYKEIGDQEISSNASNIGKPIPTLSTYIMDKHLRLLPIGTAGELCVGGEGVCRGYLNRPELTHQRFVDNPYKAGERLYRSGDLAKLSQNGDMEYLGRIDHQVKIRGFRIELGEIESHLLKHKHIKEAVVLAGEDENGDKYICAYVVSDKTVGVVELREYLSVELPDYMIPAYFVFLSWMPLTANGKVDRKALPKHEVAGEAYVPPANDLEKKLAEIWETVLDVKKVGIKDGYFNIGGDSIKAIRLLNTINESLNTNLKIVDLFAGDTIEKLSQRIFQEQKEGVDKHAEEARQKMEDLKSSILSRHLSPGDIEDIYIMSDIEKGMVYYTLKEPDAAVYHDQMVYRLNYAGFDSAAFDQALVLMMDKHPILRTSFHLDEYDDPVQIVHKSAAVDVAHFDISRLDANGQREYIKNFLIEDRKDIFNVSIAPMWRVRTFQIDSQSICLALITHHAVLDGWSVAVFMTELNNTYLKLKKQSSFTLKKLKSTYKDFVLEQMVEKRNSDTEAYWKRELDGYKRLDFIEEENKIDPGKPVVSKGFSFKPGLELLKMAKDVSVKYNVSVKNLCFAAYIYMLNMLSYENDIVVGVVGSSRPLCPDGDKILGCFLNTVPFRLKIPVNITWFDYIAAVEQKVLEFEKFNRISLMEIVEIIGESTQDRNPIFDTIFNFIDFHVFEQAEYENKPEISDDRPTVDGYVRSNTLLDFNVDSTLGGFEIFINYTNSAFEEEQIHTLCRYFVRVLEAFALNPQKLMSKASIIPDEEREKVLYSFNRTETGYPKTKTIHQLFEEQVKAVPDDIAVVANDETFGTYMTYKELNEKSDRLACRLIEKGVGAGQVVGLLVSRSLDMIVGLLGILKAGGAYLPLDPFYPEERISYILRHSGLDILLTESHLEKILRRIAFSGESLDIHDGRNYLESNFNRKSRVTSTDPAYVIYTSGSTGNPKGVMVRHYNVVNFIEGMFRSIDFSSSKRILGLTTISFDIFVLETLLPLARGMVTVIADEQQQIDSHLLAETVVRHRIDILQLTPSRLKLLFNSGRLDCLRKVKSLIIGGEAFPVHLLKELVQSFPGRIYNIYGPTETTVWSSVKELTASGAVSIGYPIANTRLYIVDRYNRLQPPGAAGELLIGGDGVAGGYINNQALTAERFIESPDIVQAAHKPALLYKTGDVARWLPNGEVDFLGRVDYQLKIRGFRIEPEEIEERLLNYTHIKEAVVVDRSDASGEKYLCAYIVPDAEPAVDGNSLREYLSRSLPDYMIPTFFVNLEKIPMTPNGKLDRQALPDPAIKTGETYTAPRDNIETKLVNIWAEVLAIDGRGQETQLFTSIGIDDNFFELGGHSLRAVTLISKIHKAFNVKIPLDTLFKIPTVRKISEYLKLARPEEFSSIKSVEKREYYLLSSGQKRLYFLHHMDETGIAYNLPFAMRMSGEVDTDRLEKAFLKLIGRHESLRTSFQLLEGEPVQRIHDHVPFNVEFLNLEQTKPAMNSENAFDTAVSEIIKSFVHKFDLTQAPLLRVGVIKTGQGYILMTDIHHIVSDGVSHSLLARDFIRVYNGESLPPLRIQYKDFSHWQRQELQAESLKKQRHYWMREFAGEVPVLNLPYDYTRPAVQGFEGSSVYFDIDAETTHALKKYALEEGATLYMVLLSLYFVLLSRLSTQEDIVVGTPLAGRGHADLQSVIGMFVKTLALRDYPAGSKSFKGFLSELKDRTLTAFENQDLPYEDLLDSIRLVPDTSRNPLFDTVFVLQNIEVNRMEIPGLKLEPYNFENNIAKFDLTFRVLEQNRKMLCEFEYSTKLFKRHTIESFTQYFNNILSAVLENKEIELSRIEILSSDQKQRLLYGFNDTAAGYPSEKTLHEIFDHAADVFPERTALVFEGSSMTYTQLREKADRLAGLLRQNGIGPGMKTIVALILERSMEMVTAILAVLKAGGAYLPIDPEYPHDRIRYMLADSSAPVLVTTRSFAEDAAEVACMEEGNREIIYIDDHSPIFIPCAMRPVSPEDPAYIIYTSGTTGKPKGTVIEHRNVVRLMFNDRFQFDFGPNDTWTMFHSYCFDFSVWEMYGALLYGGLLVVVPRSTAQDPQQYLTLLRENNVTVLNQTPSAFYNLIEEELKHPLKDLNLKYVIFGGEALKPLKLKKWRERYPHTKLINMFGITETTVHVTYKEIGDVEINLNISNIGKPIPTLSTYVMDKNLNLLPVGVAGELCVGGEGVGRGYLNRPRLTSEKFIENPYIPGERLYRSGDLGKWLENGDLEYLGRIDHQVKIRGFRIELGEIESRLLEHPQVKEAVVLAAQKGDDHKYLCAYIVPVYPTENTAISSSSPSPKNLLSDELREYLSAKLPDYMIPAYFVRIDNIPLTSNKKIDRKALPDPESRPDEIEYVAPRNEIEEMLVLIWKKVLGVERIGVKDNYFNVGGDSITAIRLLNEINAAFCTGLRIVDLFSNETIELLAGKIISENAGTSENPLDEALREIEELKNRVMTNHDLPDDVEDVYPMSDIEKGMIFYSQQENDAPLYHEQFIYQLKLPSFDTEIFSEALRLMIEKHPVLRASYNISDFGEPLRLEQRAVTLNTGHYDISDLETPAQEAHIREYLAEDRREPFNPSKPPLWRMVTFKLGNDDICLLWIFHHAILDGWSNASFITELNNTYLNLKANPDYKPGKLKNTYKIFVAEQAIEKKKAEVRDFWMNELADYKRLDIFRETKNVPGTGETQRYIRRFGDEFYSVLRKQAAQYDTTVKNICFGAYVYMLYMISFDNDLVVGNVTHNRPVCEDGEKILGCFLNTLPVRLIVPAGTSLRDYFAGIDRKLRQLKNHDKLALYEIAKITGENPRNSNPIFDTLFNFIDFHIYNQVVKNTSGEDKERLFLQGYENTNTLFDFMIDTTSGGFTIIIYYKNSMFEDEEINTLCDYFEKLLEAFIHNPEDIISKDKLLPPRQREKLLHLFNDTHRDYSPTKTVHVLFEEQVERRPDHISTVYSDFHLTYKELGRLSDCLAGELREKGVTAGTIAGVMFEPSLEMITSMLAVIKAGGTFLPIDPAVPPARKKYMLQDSGSVVLLTSRRLTAVGEEISSGFCRAVIPVGNETSFPGEFPLIHCINTPDDPAYVIYTSGTSGKPKGVVVQHKTLVNLCRWNNDYFQVTPKDHTSQYANIGFDASVWEIFPCLIGGASLFIIEEQNKLDIWKLNLYFETRGISIAFLPTQVCEYFMEIENHSLRVLRTGGDKLNKFFKRPYRLYNNYGPTENTVVASSYLVESDCGNIPIGKPISNNHIYILSRDNSHVQPVGVPGELCIAGASIAAGYLNRPELTAEKFKHPSTSLPIYPSTPLYHTGDLAQWLPDGNILFLGRIDSQVKIRGFRIETGEIENRLLEHQDITGVLVSVVDSEKEKSLCAYIVSHRELSRSELREYLSRQLPDYMIPAYFVTMEEFPLTPNGKVDRKNLPAPDGTFITDGMEFIAPRNDVEKELAEIWETVLGRTGISVNEDFFQIGGDSIKSIQIVSKMKNAGYKVEMKDIFSNSSISELAAVVREKEIITRVNYESPAASVTGVVPLTPIQKWFFSNSDNPNSHFNQAVMLYSPEGFDSEILKTVFQRIQEHHDTLRMTYEIGEGGIIQTGHGLEYPFSFQVHDLRKYEEPMETLTRLTNLIQSGIHLEKGPLMKLGLFHMDDGDHLLIVIHHLVIDGISWRILFEDIETLYRQYQKGESPMLPLKTDPFKGWAEKLIEYADSEFLLKEKSYWKELESIPIVPIEVDFDNGENYVRDTSQLSFSLSEEDTRLLLTQVNEAFHTSVNDILLTALGLGYKKTFDCSSFLLALEGHGREDIIAGMDISRTVGWFTSLYPVVLDMSNENDLDRQVKEVKETLRRVPHKGIGYGILRFLTSEKHVEDIQFKLKPQLSFNYLGQFDADVGRMSFAISHLPSGPTQDPDRVRDYELDVLGMIVDNRLKMSISYNIRRFKTETIETLLDHYQSELSRIITFCSTREQGELTPSDFGYKELSIDDLDTLFDE